MAADLTRSRPDPSVWVEQLYHRALGRRPTPAERAAALDFVRGQADLIRPRVAAWQAVGIPPVTLNKANPADTLALADLCLAVFNTNEFVYVP